MIPDRAYTAVMHRIEGNCHFVLNTFYSVHKCIGNQQFQDVTAKLYAFAVTADVCLCFQLRKHGDFLKKGICSVKLIPGWQCKAQLRG